MGTVQSKTSRPFGALAGAILILAGLFPGALAMPAAALAVSPNVVISQVYGGGGNSGATYTHDFVELFNRGTSPVSLAGMSIQYTSATGTGTFGASSTLLTELPSVSVAPGQHYLVQQATNAAVGSALPTPDLIDATPIAMAAGSGKVALVNSAASLACNGGSAPCSAAQLALIVDLVGYGSANFFEGVAAAPTLTSSTAALRASNGCTDTDNNAADFTAVTPAPRNTASPLSPCAAATPVINEFSASTAGTDVEYVEVHGTAATDYSAYRILEIEGDTGTALGTVDEVIAVGTTDAAGLWLGNLAANTLENGTITLLLVRGFTGALAQDLDTNDDGVFDVTPWDAIVDAVAVNDGGVGDRTYGVPTLGVSYDGLAFAPGGASRIPDGTDTDTAADWVRNDFDLAGIPPFTGTPVVGEAYNTPGAPNEAVSDADVAPTVTATSPTAGSTGVALATDITVTFSESVDVAAGAVRVECPSGASVAASAAATDVTTVVVNPAGDLPATTTCVIVIDAAGVTDRDGTADTLAGPTSFSFTTAAAAIVTPIHAIQGSGARSVSGTFTIEAIVVGDYQAQGSGQLRGFFVQEEDAHIDADPATSEGIFVFCSSCPVAVTVGDHVRVTGTSSEFFGMSQLSATTAGSVSVLGSGLALPTPATLELPVPGVATGDLAAATAAINAYFEQSEGMLVTFPDTLSVSEYFELARYGHLVLTEGGRPHTFTAVNTPTAGGLIDHEIDLARRSVILDDTDNIQNRPSVAPNTPYYHPVPGLSTSNYVRGGDTITNLTGVLHWSFAGQSGTDAWRIRPVTEAYSYAFTPVNTRPAVPTVDGSLKVASFNVLNYFLTVDTTASNEVGTCGPSGVMDCRGADSAQELARQRTKLLAALTAIDADVFGFMEMENTPGVEPLADLVAGLPGYAYVDTGVIGADAIRVGIIYRTAAVTPVGAHAILDSTVDPRFDDTRNRPALAQAFEENATGGRFTVVVNHLKSKGSACGPGDDDTTTGQGNCNGTRTLAAQALADWLATDPTGSGDADVLVIGDLNSYAKEDPIVALQVAGYTDLVASFGGPGAYGYVFDGQLGYLDHALANDALAPQVAGVAEWHINADEIPLLDYNDDVRDAGEAWFEEESDSFPLYEPNAFRTSDHDPVIIGLDLAAHEPVITSLTLPAAPVQLGGSVSLSATFTDADGGDTHTATIDWGDGSVQALGTITSPIGPVPHVYGAAGVYTVELTVTDASGLSDAETWEFVVVYDPAGGFVTGGGTTWSPLGALVASPDLEGPASFGFVSKYQKGANVPKGSTTFQFELGDFEFASTAYDWLVISGPRATYRGSGTVNGAGSYGFLLSARDGQVSGGGGTDKLRMKIWDLSTEVVVYDNQPEAGDDAPPVAPISTGSIVVHKGK